jgi:glycosyltransferase involved in cell wall biosynthesis
LPNVIRKSYDRFDHVEAWDGTNRMKVLYFHQYFSTRSGGTGTRSYEFAKALVDAGHDVTMVCGSYGPANTGLEGKFRFGRREGVVDGIHVIEFDVRTSNSDGFFKRALAFVVFATRSTLLALFRRSDVVFATSTPLTAGIPGIISSFIPGKRFVFEVRDLWPELPKAMGVIKNPIVLGAMGWLEWLSYKRASHCVGLAPGICEGIGRYIPEQRISLIPNGCDLDLPVDARPRRPEEIADEDFVAVFTGTHGPANGLGAVLAAAQVLKERGRPDIKILLVGDGKEKPALVAQATELSLTNVVFHDRVAKQELTGLMSGANVGLQILADVPAFYYGTSPNKFFDYLAMGLPVLNNYPGWVAELVTQNDCGIAVEAGNAQHFADALIELADNRASTKQQGGNARALAERQFSRDELSKKFVSVLEAVAQRS